MKRTMSKRSHSWWWDSHISPKNSKWLAENLEEMNHAVKQMLKLIEGDGDSFAKKAEMYYQKRPELISHVEDFYRMYRSLAERYDNVTGELRKNIPSELQTQGSGSGSDFGSESPSPSPSPEQKSPDPKQGHRAAGFDVFLGSVHPHKGSDGSSLSSESDSESDDAASKNLFSSIGQNGKGDVHHLRISELENEVYILREKLQAYEDGMKCTQNGIHVELGSSLPSLEEEFSMVKMKLSASEEDVARLKFELKQKDSVQQEVEPFYNGNNLIEAKLDLERQRAKELQEQIQALQKEVSDREQTIEQLKVEIADVKENSNHERSRLESEFHGVMESKELELELEKKRVLNLHERIDEFEAKTSDREKIIADLKVAISRATEESAQEKLQLKGEIYGLLGSYKILEAKFECLEDEIKCHKTEKCGADLKLEKLKTENAEKGRQLEGLHKDFDALKHSYDILVAEKDELSAKVLSLVAEVNSRNDKIKQMDAHLQRLHMEHMKLIKESEDAKQATQVLSGRVKDLEEEVERQRALIADHAEGKREAIRQLCFSIEHYRDGYEKLRQALHRHRRTVVMAS